MHEKLALCSRLWLAGKGKRFNQSNSSQDKCTVESVCLRCSVQCMPMPCLE